jgi:hypothetical protein
VLLRTLQQHALESNYLILHLPLSHTAPKIFLNIFLSQELRAFCTTLRTTRYGERKHDKNMARWQNINEHSGVN